LNKNQINLKALHEMIEDLANKNWSSSDDIFDPDFVKTLALECQRLKQDQLMHAASIGGASSRQLNPDIRGDLIYWLAPDEPSLINQNTQKALGQIQATLNQELFTGLRSIEAQFAFYPPGSGYQRHVDNPHGHSHRRMTFLLYLNPHWKKQDGGMLTVYDPVKTDQILFQVEPVLGRFVLFRSDLFPHQVETSFAPRMSLSGWFRSDSL
jgi:SM-20-related protein